MKIDDSLKKTGGMSVATTGTAQTRQSKGAAKAGEAPPPSASSDSVSLSPQVRSLAKLASSGGVFDAAKVEEIKAAIAEGRFQVDPEKVATGLLDTVTDLINSRKG